MSYWKITLLTLGIIPFGFIVSLLAFYFHAARVLGHPPSYNHPDPKSLSIYAAYAPWVDLAANLWFYSFFFWLAAIVFYFIRYRKNISWKPVCFSAFGQFVAILLFLSRIFEWYID